MSLDSVFKLSVIVSMIDNLTGPAARINNSVNNSVNRISSLNQTFGAMTKSGLATAALGAEITKAVLGPVAATFETRKALGELASLGVKDLETVDKAARNFSDTWAGTTKANFITAAYDIRSGISSLSDEAVARFTEIAGITAKGTKSTVVEMTSLFASGYNIYKDYYKQMSDIEFGEMFSAGIAKSVQQFKTTGSGMAQAISMLGASATTSNVPLEEQLSILGMLQATMSGSEAGTKYKQFIMQAASAGKELGIKFTDANNSLLGMPQILQLLRGKFGETMDAAEKMQLQKAFGSQEAVAVIDLLYSKTGSLEDNIVSMYDSLGGGTKLATDMANAINSTEGDQYTLLIQQIQNLNQEMGKRLLPTINAFLSGVKPVVQAVTNWSNSHQEATKTIGMVVMILGLLLITFGSVVTVFGTLGLLTTQTIGFFGGLDTTVKVVGSAFDTMKLQAMYAGDAMKGAFGGIKSLAGGSVSSIRTFVIGMVGMARQAIVTAVTAMPGLIASVWGFTAALLANPMTWIVLGIMALIAVIILLWQNWGAVTLALTAGWEWMKQAATNVWNALASFFMAYWPYILGIFTGGIGLIIGLIIQNWDSVKQTTIGVFDNVKNTISGFIEGIKQFWNDLKVFLSNPIQGVVKLFKKTDEDGKIPGYATGGIITRPTLATFAETGPEAAIPLNGSARSIGLWQTVGNMLGVSVPTNDSAEEQTQKLNPSNSKSASPRLNLREIFKEVRSTETTQTVEKSGGTIIQKLEIKVDITKLKDLPALFKLLDQIRNYVNSSGANYDIVLEG